LRGGGRCTTPALAMKSTDLRINLVTSKSRERYWDDDVLLATAALEVGVDDERFKATIHYRPPLSVFSFLQRRGWAGRAAEDSAYTVLVLGNDPNDEFYFRRRRRLLDGNNFELPLNPMNSVVEAMHNRLEEARNAILERTKANWNIPQAIMLWILEQY